METIETPTAGRTRLVTFVGYLVYIGMLGAGYYYNLTFVQLGLIDLGTRRVGMSEARVSVAMAGFALIAFVLAYVTGRLMDRRRWSANLRIKLRILFGVVLVVGARRAVVDGDTGGSANSVRTAETSSVRHSTPSPTAESMPGDLARSERRRTARFMRRRIRGSRRFRSRRQRDSWGGLGR